MSIESIWIISPNNSYSPLKLDKLVASRIILVSKQIHCPLVNQAGGKNTGKFTPSAEEGGEFTLE